MNKQDIHLAHLINTITSDDKNYTKAQKIFKVHCNSVRFNQRVQNDYRTKPTFQKVETWFMDMPRLSVIAQSLFSRMSRLQRHPEQSPSEIRARKANEELMRIALESKTR